METTTVVLAQLQPSDKTLARIADFKRQLAQQAGRFDWRHHNELHHLYGSFDDRQAYYHMRFCIDQIKYR